MFTLGVLAGFVGAWLFHVARTRAAKAYEKLFFTRARLAARAVDFLLSSLDPNVRKLVVWDPGLRRHFDPKYIGSLVDPAKVHGGKRSRQVAGCASH